VADAYRQDNELLTSDQIRSIRGSLSQISFAQQLGVGPASVKRWELGLVQDKSNDNLIRDFKRNSRPLYVYDVPVRVHVASAVVGCSLLEGWAHGPPIELDCLCPSLL
jgi:hypothetical protein